MNAKFVKVQISQVLFYM